jgi:hypothetical protein
MLVDVQGNARRTRVSVRLAKDAPAVVKLR